MVLPDMMLQRMSPGTVTTSDVGAGLAAWLGWHNSHMPNTATAASSSRAGVPWGGVTSAGSSWGIGDLLFGAARWVVARLSSPWVKKAMVLGVIGIVMRHFRGALAHAPGMCHVVP